MPATSGFGMGLRLVSDRKPFVDTICHFHCLDLVTSAIHRTHVKDPYNGIDMAASGVDSNYRQLGTRAINLDLIMLLWKPLSCSSILELPLYGICFIVDLRTENR